MTHFLKTMTHLKNSKTHLKNSMTHLKNSMTHFKKTMAYIMNSMLRSVVVEGSGNRVQREIGRGDLMGKTGTTNGPQELCLSGFNRPRC